MRLYLGLWMGGENFGGGEKMKIDRKIHLI